MSSGVPGPGSPDGGSTAPFPWWLGGGTERCQFCSRSYPWEDARRCGGCDQALCPLCAQPAEGDQAIACPDCTD